MKRIAVLWLVLLGAGIAHGEDQLPKSHEGYWWADKSDSAKVHFVAGYIEAMTRIQDELWMGCIGTKSGGTVPAKVPPDEVLEACGQTVTRYNFGNIRFGQMSEGVDAFYKDFRNKNININLAMNYVRDQLKGKSDKELEETLAGYRRRASTTSNIK